MKGIAIGLATGALSMFLLAPCVKAQSWQDMQNDQGAIEEGQEQLHHDRQELRNDVRNGDYAAAAHEQAEMNHRRAAIDERREDLTNGSRQRRPRPKRLPEQNACRTFRGVHLFSIRSIYVSSRQLRNGPGKNSRNWT